MRVLVVDDSALMRRHMREIFEAEGDMTLEFARNGREALERNSEFKPDVITLDVNMPEMDGLSCLARIMADDPRPVVMVSSLTEKGAEVTLKALELGAVDFVPKPDGTVSLSINSIRRELVAKVRAAAKSRMRRATGLRERVRRQKEETEMMLDVPRGASASYSAPAGMVLVGVSTGGPRTLEEVLPLLPRGFKWPVLVAQHMPSSFTNIFAQRIDTLCDLDVIEVSQPVPIERGKVYIGKGDADLVIERRLGRIIANSVPVDGSLWHPSADRLVNTAMQVMPARNLIGVLLTGMGSDGAKAMAELRRRGGRTIAESEATSVVFGMPKELIDLGGASSVLPCGRVAEELIGWVGVA